MDRPLPEWVLNSLRVAGVAAFWIAAWKAVVWWDKDEKAQTRCGIAPEEWERGKRQVAANMDGRPPWLRKLHEQWNQVGSKGEKERLNRRM